MYVKYNTFVTFDRLYFILDPLHRSNGGSSHTLNGSNDVLPDKEMPFGGKNDGESHLKEICSNFFLKWE